METLFHSTLLSPIGPLTLVFSETALVSLTFGPALPKMRASTRLVEANAEVADYRSQLQEYFAGERQQFTIALDLRGTDFQRECWRALLTIPYGETRTYAELARMVGRPRAFRAVGMANHDNPVAVIVPCHRVIASDGSLAGYAGGLSAKQWLLNLERQHSKNKPQHTSAGALEAELDAHTAAHAKAKADSPAQD